METLIQYGIHVATMFCIALVWALTAPSGTHRNTSFPTQINLANNSVAIIISNGMGNPRQGREERVVSLTNQSNTGKYSYFQESIFLRAIILAYVDSQNY